MPHRCLLIPEILRIICLHIKIHHRRDRSRDLQAVALVCRSFYNASLDLLWRDVTGLLPLLRTLPSDVWSGPLTRHKAVLARAIIPSDLERFRAYACCVQVYGDHYIDVPITIYHALSFHFHDRPIFPNLVKISWRFERREIFPYISMFLGPRIREMELNVSGDSVQISLLPTLGTRCPSLVHFELSTPDCYPDIGQQMKSLLSQWGQLETLIIYYLPEESLRIVAALPHLRSFTLSRADDDYGDAFSPTPGTNAFPALQDLSITASSPVLCINILKAAKNCSLKEFTFSLFGTNLTVWRDLFATLAELCNKGNLTSISVDDLVVQAEEQDPGTADELRLLFPLTGLTRLVFTTRCGFDIDDAFMHEMAGAWPRMHTLNIGAAEIFQPFEPQRLTLQGLAPLAELCPDLRNLTVHINVAHICSNHFDACLGSGSGSCVDYLDVARSPISKESVPWAAAYLSALFPKLRELQYEDDYMGFEQPAYPDRWEDVENHLAVYRHVSGYRGNDSHCSNCALHA
ncbi:hypothetical protein BD779DRAFT_537688 [Infundibulicybe gibba]|nr:hypothetical protein BD779DRAFT_537688 [Infundibulicybe gibba]